MNERGEVTLAEFRRAVEAAIARVLAASDELCELDAVAGDGDLGSNLALGFEAVRETALDTPGDIGALLSSIGRTLALKAPSTIGTLLGSAFMRAGKALAGAVGLDAAGVAAMFDEMAASVAERGGAAVGERTVLDAMVAASGAAGTVASSGATPLEALAAAAAAATAAAEETAGMNPRHGRAGWIGERARGRPDAGATAWAIYVTGVSEGAAEPAAAHGEPPRPS